MIFCLCVWEVLNRVLIESGWIVVKFDMVVVLCCFVRFK